MNNFQQGELVQRKPFSFGLLQIDMVLFLLQVTGNLIPVDHRHGDIPGVAGKFSSLYIHA
jgi:hypothetical protein